MKKTKNMVKAFMAISVALAFVVPGSAVIGISRTSENVLPSGSTSVTRGTIYVDDDQPSVWYDATHVRTIQEGITNATTGDTVYVYNGTYNESVAVNKQVSLVGESRENVIVRGNGIGNVFYITTPVTYVSMRSFSITNAQYGIYVYKSSYNTFMDCDLYNNTNSGIYLFSTSNYNVITNCEAYNNTMYGIYIRSASYNSITRCDTFNNLNHGIFIASPATYNIMSDGTSYNNANSGVYLSYCSNTRVTNYAVYTNDYGITLQGASINYLTNVSAYNNTNGFWITSGSNTNNIRNCTVYNNTNTGIFIRLNSNANVVTNCTNYHNKNYGLYIYQASNSNLRDNTLNNNGYNFAVSGTTVTHFIQDIDSSNTVDGKTIQYLYNQHDVTLNETHNFGYLGLISCTNITAMNTDVSGIVMVGTSNSMISNVSVHNSTNGIHLLSSSNNVVVNCDSYNNSNSGFYLQGSSHNLIIGCDAYGNTFGYYIYSSSTYNQIIDSSAYSNRNQGISLQYNSNDNNVTNCTAYNNTNHGIYLNSNANNNITGSTAYNNTYGIYCISASNNKLRGNAFYDNIYNFAVDGTAVADFILDVDPSNTVSGKPIYYLHNQHNLTISETNNVGYLGLISCSNISVKNSVVEGVLVIDTVYSTITNVSEHNSGIGMYLFGSSHNVITDCVVYNNTNYGIYLVNSLDTVIMNSTVYNNENYGIFLFSPATSSHNNSIINCTAFNNNDGFCIIGSSDNVITDCTAYDNTFGLFIGMSSNNRLRNNTFFDNVKEFAVDGTAVGHYIQDIDPSNSIQGKTIRYLVGESNIEVNEACNVGYLGLVSCSNITAQNLDVSGVILIGTTGTMISNVSSHTSGNGYGIYLWNSWGNTITDCTTYDNDYGIFLASASNTNMIVDCTAYGNYDGVYLVDSSNNLITGCTAYSNTGTGILIQAESNHVTDCSAYSNNVGIFIFEYAFYNTVTNCTTYNNAYGIFVYRTVTNVIATCDVYSNSEYGIYIYQASDTNITNCNIYSNKFGVSIEWNADYNLMYHNNFINNQYNAFDACSNTWDDGYPSGGNYWSDYTGVDNFSGPHQNVSGSDGIGDTPYGIFGGSNTDWYPLMNPLDTTPPVISAVQATPAVQNTTLPVNITCTVTDNWDLVDIVKINITGPEGFTLEEPMNEGSYYYENIYTSTGVYYYFIRAVDTSGNIAVSDTYSFVIKVDFDLPVSSVNPISLWKKTVPFPITATAYDNTAVATVTLWYRSSDNGTTWSNWTSYGTDVTAPWNWSFQGDDGYYEFYSIAVDDSGNIEDPPGVADAFTGVDTTKPITTVDFNGTVGDNTWYTSSVTVSFLAVDALSGVESTWYKLDAGYWTFYSVPFLIHGQGQHTVSYYSFDVAGNMENTHTSTINIDTAAPATTHTLEGILGSDGYVSNVTVTLNASDATSGVNYTHYKLNLGDWILYTEPFTVTEDGNYTLYYCSVDLAGNTESTQEIAFTIKHDGTPPVTTHEFSGMSGTNGWFVNTVTVVLQAVDDSAGVEYTTYRLDDGNWTTYVGVFSVTDEAVHIFEYYSVDKVGNKEETHAVEIKIDRTVPVINLTVEKTGISKWLLTATVSDETSGINRVEFYFDDQYLGTVTTAPYTWEVTEKGLAQAIVYDNAGHSAMTEKTVSYDLVVPESQSQSYPSSQTQTLVSSVIQRLLTLG